MLPVPYRANSAFYPQKGTFIEFRDRRVADLLLTNRQDELLQRLAEIHRIPFASPSDDEIRAALAEAGREAEWDDYRDHREMAERATARGQIDRADKLERETQAICEAWFISGVIDRGRVQSPVLVAAVGQRAEWARRYDPIRLTIEHDRFCAEHIHERRARHEFYSIFWTRIDLSAMRSAIPLVWRAIPQQWVSYYTGSASPKSFSYAGCRSASLASGSREFTSPIYFRENNARRVPMPVRLNAFPELPNGRRPIYVTQQKNEALYFKLDEARVRRWLSANQVLGLDQEGEKTIGAIYLENYTDFGAFLDEFKEREGRGRAPRSVSAYIYLLLHSLSHQVMHALADVSGLDRDGLGEHVFPADLAFVVYRKGMTPDLGNISAMWRNHSEASVERLLDQRLLRCGSGSLCDTRGGACPACIMVSEVTCIGGNQLLSRAALKGGPAPNWEPQDSPPLVGFFDPALYND